MCICQGVEGSKQKKGVLSILCIVVIYLVFWIWEAGVGPRYVEHIGTHTQVLSKPDSRICQKHTRSQLLVRRVYTSVVYLAGLI